MKILVTGATGFIGRNVLEHLRGTDHEVHAVSMEGALASEERVKWHRANLLVPADVERLMADARPTHLIHLAWYAVHRDFWTSPENLDWVGATIGIVRTFAEHGGKRAIAVGSCAEYDWRHGHCVEDLTPLNPRTLYGSCKHAAHVAVEMYARQVGVIFTWARLFNMYGPHEHQTRFVASLIRSALRGERNVCHHGQLVRDFLDVGDAARALVGLCGADIVGAVNIGSGHPVRLGDLARRIGALTGRAELITVEDRPTVDTAVLTADVTRLRSVVGTPEASLDEGLARAIAWWSTRLNDRELGRA